MKMSMFKTLFKQKSSSYDLLHSEVFKKLEDVCKKQNLYIYKDITIYHHTRSFNIPLLVLDPTRGIFLFEYKTWVFKNLKNVTAKLSKEQETSDKSLAFDNAHKIIRQKFNELTHNNGVDIFNFVLMENLSVQEYEQLDVSLQKLLPMHRVIFNDSTDTEILHKLQGTNLADSSLPDVAHIMGSLLIQHLILSDENSMYMATQEQVDFIEDTPDGYQSLSAKKNSGKTSAILLKAVLYKLKNPNKKVIIISPSILVCDILKKKLLDIVEHAIIELDIISIEIITPSQLLQRHLNKYNMLLAQNNVYVHPILMKKRFNVADLIICDDADLLPDDFISYLKHIQSKANLIVSSNKEDQNSTFVFKQNHRSTQLKIKFIEANPHAKALQIISKLLKENTKPDIVVVSNEESKKQLKDDLEFFIDGDATLLDSSKNLIDQKLNNLLLTTYKDINYINTKFVILLITPQESLEQLKYAIDSAKQSVYALYEEKTKTIIDLKEHYRKGT